MAIKLAQVKKVRWPVTVNVPQDGGRVLAETFDVDFKVLTQSELRPFGDIRPSDDESKDMLNAVVVGWPKGPKGEDGQPVPFDEDAKAELLGTTYARTALYNAYSEIQTGRAAARKN